MATGSRARLTTSIGVVVLFLGAGYLGFLADYCETIDARKYGRDGPLAAALFLLFYIMLLVGRWMAHEASHFVRLAAFAAGAMLWTILSVLASPYEAQWWGRGLLLIGHMIILRMLEPFGAKQKGGG